MTTERLGVLVSHADDVSERIGEQLLDLTDWEVSVDDARPAAEGGGTVYRCPGVELRTVAERHLDTEGVAEVFEEPRLIAIASRHAGDTGPLLTAHHTGNFGPAEHGGQNGELSRAAPNAHAEVLSSLEKHAPAGYAVGMECTHHGPSAVGAPSLFVEVGSGPEQWNDEGALRAAAQAILDLTDVPADAPIEDGRRRHLVGFGGGHYAPRFERIVRETDWAVGHVAADWCLEEMGDPRTVTDVLDAAFTASAATLALLEDDRPELADAIESLGYRIVGETWVRETSAVPLSLVDALEEALGPVDAGLRFGAPASDTDGRHERSVSDADGRGGSFVVGEIPGELLAAVNAVDADEALEAVDDLALGYETENNGSRLAGPVALASDADEDRLLGAFVTVLASGYDVVQRDGDAIVASRTEFDPDLARAAGVSPGPDFGRLDEGESVTVDGDVVTPDEVTVERERTIPATVITD